MESALGLSGGLVLLDFVDLAEDDPHRERKFSEHLACPNDHPLAIEDLEPRVFSFNSPYGACPECTGLGTKKEVDPELIVPDVERSLREGAIQPWSGGSTLEYFLRLLEALGTAEKFSIDTPWRQLPARAQKTILYGSEDQVHVRYRNKYGRERSYYTGFEGVVQWIERRHSDTESDWSREKYEGYMRDVPCPACGGARLKPEVLAVTIAGKQHRRGLQPVRGRVRRAAGVVHADRPAEDDRRAGAQGDQRPVAVPGRRGAGLPVAGPARGHALRR